MNNTERIIWLSILILGAFFCENQVSKVESLELLNQQIQISLNLKNDQLLELSQKIPLLSAEKYNQGLESGKTQAMIASMNDKNIIEYKDGYHAALSQFNFNNQDKFVYKTILDVLDSHSLLEEDYQDLLNILLKNWI